jgi:phosphoglycolate phosphatase
VASRHGAHVAGSSLARRLLIFDCDGTLVDSRAGIVRVLRMALADLGLDDSGCDAALAEVIGLSLPQAAAALLPDQSHDMQTRLVDAYRHHYKLCADAGELRDALFPGTRELLVELHAAGHILAIATGKSMRGLQRTLEDHDLGGLFQSLSTADTFPSKPNPAMVEAILDQHNLPPEDAMMIGDTTYDIEMGHYAGVWTCAVTFGCHTRAQLATARPHYWINTMDELRTLLA